MSKPYVFIITGISGSGKSTAIKAFEDFGYYCVDNLPVSLIPSFLQLCETAGEEINKIALVVDVREGRFLKDFNTIYNELKEQNYPIKVLFFEASNEVIKSRFKETKRRHPLSEGYNMDTIIQKEREMLLPIRDTSDAIIDTSTMNIYKLKERIKKIEGVVEEKSIELNIISFGFKYGIPTDADIVIDVRCLPNPFFKEELRPFDGTDLRVRKFVIDNDISKEFISRLLAFINYVIKLYDREGRSILNIAIGCTGGKHRSVAIASYLKEQLKKEWSKVVLFHKDIDR